MKASVCCYSINITGTKASGAPSIKNPRVKHYLYCKVPVSPFVLQFSLLMCLSQVAAAEPQGTKSQAELTSQHGEFSPLSWGLLDHSPDHTGFEAFSPLLARRGPNFSFLTHGVKLAMVVCSRGGGRARSFPPVCWRGCEMQDGGCRMLDMDTEEGCQEGAQGGGAGGGCRREAGRVRGGRAPACSAVLLVASRGGSCPSNEVQH